MTYLRLLIAAAIAGLFYLLGARAGRGRYKQIRRNAHKAWNDKTVKKARAGTKKFANRNVKNLAKAARR